MARSDDRWQDRLAGRLPLPRVSERPRLQPDAAAPPETRSDLLVMVDAMWVLWGPFVCEPERQQPWQRHERFLRSLLTDEHGNTDTWVLHDPGILDLGQLRTEASGPIAAEASRLHTELLNGSWAEGSPGECEPGPDEDQPWQQWHTGQTAAGTVARLVEGLRVCNQMADREHRSDAALVGLLNFYGCRIYLHPGQLDRLCGAPVKPEMFADHRPHACLDLRFRHHVDRYWLYATLSLWSHRPASVHHVPTPPDPRELVVNGTAGGREPLPDVRALGRDMVAVRKEFYNRLKDIFEPIRLTVFEQRYRPPRFWITSGVALATATLAGGSTDGLPAMRALSRDIRQIPEPGVTGVAQGVVEGSVRGPQRVLRWFVNRESAPCYLVIPSRGVPLKLQEDAVRELVYRMTAIEAQAAAALYNVSTELDINQTLVGAYQEVADRAGALWDELSMFFPMAHGRHLDEPHSLAELIHQILLQGVADLELVHTKAHQLRAMIRTEAESLVEEFDRTFIEVPVPAAEPIRESVRRGGYVARTERRTKETCENAGRARDTYKALLEGVTYAFDERRVRLTDKVGLVALGFGLMVALFGFVTEPWGAFLQLEWQDKPHLIVLGVAALVFFGLSLGAYFYARRRLGVLKTSAEFTKHYEHLRHYLAATGTDKLRRVRAQQQDELRKQDAAGPATAKAWWAPYFRSWDELDRRLAAECAEVLDRLTNFSLDGTRRRATDELVDLRARIERWALVSLFITERPRSFHRFPLPRLTLLYRCYPIWQRVYDPHGGPGQGLVADSDLWLLLRIQCRARPNDVREVQLWADRLAERARSQGLSAVDILQTITDTGIKAGMTEAEWAVVHKGMCPPAKQHR